jgi:hypothetical protein
VDEARRRIEREYSDKILLWLLVKLEGSRRATAAVRQQARLVP